MSKVRDSVEDLRTVVVEDSSGNVGIGTSFPTHKLVVSGENTAAIEINNSDTSIFTDQVLGEVLFTGDDDGVSTVGASISTIALQNWSSNNQPGILVFKTNSGADNAERVRIDSSGNVGIGTSSPNAVLQAVDGSGVATIALDNSRSNVGDLARLDLRHNGITGSQIKSAALDDFSTTANRTSDLSFHVRNSGTIIQAATIDSSGNVGIGVVPNIGWSSNYTALQIGGSTSIMAGNSANANGPYILNNTRFDGAWKYNSTGAAASYEMVNGGHKFRVAPSGTVDAAFTFTDAITITNAGNVGIGKPSPSTTLDVNGTVTADAVISDQFELSTSTSNWTSFRQGSKKNHTKSLGALAIDSSRLLCRIRIGWWGSGWYKITLKEYYYGPTSAECSWWINGHGQEVHGGNQYSIASTVQQGSINGSFVSIAPGQAANGNWYTDVYLNAPSYKAYYVDIETIGITQEFDVDTTNQNSYVLY